MLAQGYEWQVLPNAPVAARHDDVQFLDPFLGWVVNGSGEVHRTTDGGLSWELQLQVTPYLRSLHFVDAAVGLVGTLEGADLLYRTTNGGASWTRIDSLLPVPRPQGICGLTGVGDHVFGCGRYFGGWPRFIHSPDRGATWTSVELVAYARNVVDCWFVTPDSGFVVGGTPAGGEVKPLILFTPDAGRTWQTRYTGVDPGDYCWKIFFVTRQVGYVSIQGTAVLKTTDSGLTWVRKPVPGIDGIQGIGFATEKLGWVDGFVGSSMMTTDGGDTWEPAVIGQPDPAVDRFQMLSETLGYAAGTTIYKYLPAAAAVELAAAPRGPGLELMSHPNPTAARTTITYLVPEGGPVKVRIYDVLGRQIRTLRDRDQAAGANAVDWDVKDDGGRPVGAGIYLYRVDAGGRAESRRMLVVR